MNIRTLRNNLPKSTRVTREDRKNIRVEADGLKYRVSDEAGSAEEAAELLRSKLPVSTLMPR
jgi:hypothetical protein